MQNSKMVEISDLIVENNFNYLYGKNLAIFANCRTLWIIIVTRIMVSSLLQVCMHTFIHCVTCL